MNKQRVRASKVKQHVMIKQADYVTVLLWKEIVPLQISLEHGNFWVESSSRMEDDA